MRAGVSAAIQAKMMEILRRSAACRVTRARERVAGIAGRIDGGQGTKARRAALTRARRELDAAEERYRDEWGAIPDNERGPDDSDAFARVTEA